jgi:hypothetical protein
MSKAKGILHQFASSTERMNTWPDWLRDSSKVATASLPKVQQGSSPPKGESRPAHGRKK